MFSTPIALLIIRPTLAWGGCTPSPSRLRVASFTTCEAISRVVAVRISPSTFGAICTSRIRGVEAPIARAAST